VVNGDHAHCRTSDIGQRTSDNEQRTSRKMATTKTESVTMQGIGQTIKYDLIKRRQFQSSLYTEFSRFSHGRDTVRHTLHYSCQYEKVWINSLYE